MKLQLSLFLSVLAGTVVAQDNNIYSTIAVGANANLPNRVPFWFRANQFGSTPLPGASTSVYGSFYKYYDTTDNPLIDWGGGLSVRGDVGSQVKGTIVEGYLKAAIDVFEIKAGRFGQQIGLADSTLSSGSFSASGNALGIPQVQLSMPEFYSIPVLNELFAFKGSFSLGWPGQLVGETKGTNLPHNTYYHQKSLYVRLGSPDWRVHLTGGFNHQVMYGGEKGVFGNGYSLNGVETFSHVVFAKKYQGRRIGNNLGSIDMGAEIELNSVRIFLYRQNFFNKNALFHLNNLQDGLNGISLTNKEPGYGNVRWYKAVFELLNSKHQGYGNGSYENYYNDGDYNQGWSYKGTGIGNPLMSNTQYLRYSTYNSTDKFINNRVVALHAGLEAGIFDFGIKGRVTYSRNYGTFSSDQVVATHNVSLPSIQSGVNQLSTYLEISRSLPHDLKLSAAGAFDYGKLLYNSAGVSVMLTKSF